MNYFKNVANEMKKVTWPSFSEVNKYTWTVLMMVIIFAVYFGVIDYGFSELINWLVTL